MVSIYNPNTFELLYNFPKVISGAWTKRFYEPGNFTIKLSAQSEGLQYIKKGVLVVDGDNCGIISYRSKTDNGIEIRGRDLKGLCNQRLVVPPFVYMAEPTVESGYDRVKGTEEEILRHYANMHLINCTDEARRIPNMILAEHHGFGADLVWQARFTNLADELRNICIYSQLGYDVLFDVINKRYVFDVLQGTDRTQTDSWHGLAVFSEARGNITALEYTEDATDEVNVAYVLGDGEEERQFVYEAYSNAQSGFDRKESSTTAGGTDTDYVDEVVSTGIAFVKENKVKEGIDASANTKLQYKKDWFLGDFVTVVVKDCFGEALMLNKQITEVVEEYAYGSYTVKPTFGEKKQSIIKKIIRS